MSPVSEVLLLVTVLAAGDAQAVVDFDNRIIPVLTKAGCNTGACHGAAVGRGGFRLSLYGSDPEFDYQSIVLDLEGRRVNPARSKKSLVFLKATESISHGGGFRLDPEESGAQLLLDWIAAGTPRTSSRSLVEFTVSPATRVVERTETPIPLRASARFTDQSSADVTAWTVFTPEDPAAVDVDPRTAVAMPLRRGRHIVVARYLDRVVPIELVVPLRDTPVDISAEPRHNFIDDHILERLAMLRLPVSPAADDAMFLRRVTLDLTGRLPTTAAVDAFAINTSATRREELVDHLLDSEAFTDFWTFRLAELLRIRSQPQDSTGALIWHQWLRQQVADAVPYDRVVRDLLTSVGDTHVVGPANFHRAVGGAREQAELASELFMGCRLRCANCHNHPLDRWTQDDYHGLAAIFAKIDRGRIVTVSTGGEVMHPRTGQIAVARIPGERFLDNTTDARNSFAQWITDHDNPYFARAIVNRMWAVLMGRGLVEPTDDLRDTNPATHPALLKELADDFVGQGFDLRHTLRGIARSATYGRSATLLPDNIGDDRFYSHARVRPLPPHVLADAISDVLEVPDRYGDQPVGTRAVTLFDANIDSAALDILGRCSRSESCEAALSTSSTGGLTTKLHMLNGPLLNHRIADPHSRLTRLIANRHASGAIVQMFYRSALSRMPTAAERDYWVTQLRDASGENTTVLEDFVWSLLTCREFVTNH